MTLTQNAYTVHQVHYSRDERKAKIIDLLSKQGRGVKLTTAQIARFIGMAKSPHVSNMLAELCFAGVIICEWGKTFNNLDVRTFCISGEE